MSDTTGACGSTISAIGATVGDKNKLGIDVTISALVAIGDGANDIGVGAIVSDSGCSRGTDTTAAVAAATAATVAIVVAVVDAVDDATTAATLATNPAVVAALAAAVTPAVIDVVAL